MTENIGYILKEDICVMIPGASDISDPVPNSSIEIIENTPNKVVFDLINAPAAYANALRRTLLSEVPSIAFEVVSILDNNGAMPDELLSHRIGLVPLNTHPGILRWLSEHIVFDEERLSENVFDESRKAEFLLFGLHVKGGYGPVPDYSNITAADEGKLPPLYLGGTDPSEREDPYNISSEVLSKYFVWMPYPGQDELFKESLEQQYGINTDIPLPGVLFDEIPLTKIVPGQTIHLYCRAVKGIGSDHAKFQPVSTAFYRMVPSIKYIRPPAIKQKRLNMLKESCPLGLFDIEGDELVIKDQRKCTACRECIRGPEIQGLIELGKIANRYEFTVESVGVRDAADLVKEALDILSKRSLHLRAQLYQIKSKI